MATTKLNTYEIGVNNDLSNVANNVDYNRLGTDLTTVVYDSGFKIKVGSVIECNGSLYAVDTSDVVIAGNGFIYFDDSTVSWVASSTAPVWDAARLGFYSGANRRCTKWSIASATNKVTEVVRFVSDAEITSGRLVRIYTGATNKYIEYNPTSNRLITNIDLAILDPSNPLNVSSHLFDEFSLSNSSAASKPFLNIQYEGGDQAVKHEVIRGGTGASWQFKHFFFDSTETEDTVYDALQPYLATNGSGASCLGRFGVDGARYLTIATGAGVITLTHTSGVKTFSNGLNDAIGTDLTIVFI